MFEKKENKKKSTKDLNTIKIAVISSKSGVGKTDGEKLFMMSRFIVDEINKDGGILNKKIELLEFDAKSSPLHAKEAALKAVKENVIAVIGDNRSSNSFAMAQVLEENKIIMIATASTNPKITMVGDYIFRICYNDIFQGQAIANFAYNDLKARNGIIFVNTGNIYSIGLADYINKSFSSLNGNIISEIEYLNNIIDFDPFIKIMNNRNPDVIFLTGYTEDSAHIIKSIRKINKNIPIISGDGWTNEIFEYGGDSIFKCYSTGHWHKDYNPGYRNDLIKKFEKKYGSINEATSLLTYDCFNILFNAIYKANSLDNYVIRDKLAETRNYNGVTGKISFDYNGDAFKEVILKKYENGKVEYVKPFFPETIKIASIFAKTGEASLGNLSSFAGIRFVIDDVNLNNGINNKLIELIEIDNQSTPITTIEAAKKAINENVIAVIGASWSSNSLAMAPYLQKAKIPMITPLSSNPEVTLVGNYIFRVCFTDEFQGKIMAKFAYNELNARKAVTLTNTNSKFSIGLNSIFASKFEEFGGKIVWDGEYLDEATDYTDIIKKIKELQPDVIYLPGYLRDTGFIITQARKYGIDAVFLGPDSWDNDLYEFGGKAIEGGYYTNFWARQINTPISKKFVNDFEKRYNELTRNNVAQSYDAVMLLIHAIKKSKSHSSSDIRDSIAAVKNFEGVTGIINFDENGDPINKSAVILKFENNSSKFVKIVNP